MTVDFALIGSLSERVEKAKRTYANPKKHTWPRNWDTLLQQGVSTSQLQIHVHVDLHERRIWSTNMKAQICKDPCGHA